MAFIGRTIRFEFSQTYKNLLSFKTNPSSPCAIRGERQRNYEIPETMTLFQSTSCRTRSTSTKGEKSTFCFFENAQFGLPSFREILCNCICGGKLSNISSNGELCCCQIVIVMIPGSWLHRNLSKGSRYK